MKLPRFLKTKRRKAKELLEKIETLPLAKRKRMRYTGRYISDRIKRLKKENGSAK